MQNKAMEKMLKNGEALDVRKIGIEMSQGIFKLKLFEDNIDYCDSETENWIWSIGKNKTTGEIFASLDTRFYSNKEFECLWLR